MISFLEKRSGLLNWLALIGIIVLMGMIFFYAPTERTMGYVQKLFYFHVGTAWVAAITFFVSLICGVLYLLRRKPILDTISAASVEIGMAFATMTIVSGSIWGKPAWNTYWLWSPRLTSMTILWLVYIAYFILRSVIHDEERKRRFSAVYAIAGFATVIISYGSIRVLRDIHPVMFGSSLETAQGLEQGLQEFSGVDSALMQNTLLAAIVVFSIIYLAWVANRIKLDKMQNRINRVKAYILAHE